MSSTFSPIGTPPQNEFLDPVTITNYKTYPLPMVMKAARLTQGWQHWISDLFNLVQALTSSGTTTNRPTKFIWTGRTYFDTTINKPIWVKSMTGATVNWVDATGTGV